MSAFMFAAELFPKVKAFMNLLSFQNRVKARSALLLSFFFWNFEDLKAPGTIGFELKFTLIVDFCYNDFTFLLMICL